MITLSRPRVNCYYSDDTVSIQKTDGIENIYKVIKRECDLFNLSKIDPESKVVIKPNLCAIKSPETGTTTDPRVIEAIVRYLKNEVGISQIYIVESDGTQVQADMAFKLLGYEKLSNRLGVKLVNLSKTQSYVKQFPENIFLRKLKVPAIMEEADFFISVPKIKTHFDIYLTCALKNQYGCNPYPQKHIYHNRLDDAIVDLNLIFKPNFIVVDGLVGMEGYKGPTNGVPVRMNLLIFGRDPVAVDHLVARIIGIDPKKVRYIAKAERKGIGTTHYKISGEDWKKVRKKFKINRPKWWNLYGLLSREC